MGHHVLSHVIKLIAFECILIMISCYASYRLAGPVTARFKNTWGFDVPWDFAAVPFGILAVWTFSLAAMPIDMAFSHHVEHEADRFGLELTHNNRAAASAFVKLLQDNPGSPRPGPIFRF
jgi:Zn-dependent protease with chaperone function